MNITIEDKKKEAAKRMGSMGIFEDAISAFEEKDKVMVSEAAGILYDFNSDTYSNDVKEAAKKFEKEYNALIYFIIQTHTTLGTMYSMFYVSDEEEEWEMDHEDIESQMACVYVYNEDAPELSEIGSIQFESINGGLVRVG